jgi:hypothetical protein
LSSQPPVVGSGSEDRNNAQSTGQFQPHYASNYFTALSRKYDFSEIMTLVKDHTAKTSKFLEYNIIRDKLPLII